MKEGANHRTLILWRTEGANSKRANPRSESANSKRANLRSEGANSRIKRAISRSESANSKEANPLGLRVPTLGLCELAIVLRKLTQDVI